MITPSYKNLSDSEFDLRISRGYRLMERCVLCPRHCGVRRLDGELGHCRTGAQALVSSHNSHHGEEPPISASGGSGTIFFSFCNLHCCFCQNYPISQLGHGRETDRRRLAQMMLSLQQQGCHNINLVTPSHVVPQVIQAIAEASRQGLHIPIAYNSSGYDSVAELELLEGIVDIYMPDMKYARDEMAVKYSQAPNYVQINRAAIREIYRQVGNLQMDEQCLAVKGLIIRHLVLPNNLAGTEDILRFIAQEISPRTYISLMGQYFPAHKAHSIPELSRRLTQEEYDQAVETASQLELENTWVQELGLD